MAKPKLYIPGPIQVSEKTFKAFSQPMMGHRSKDFQELYARVQPGLQKLFYTRQPVFMATGSAWSVMEASIRNLVSKKVLTCMNGAFSDKWYGVATANGKQAEKLQVEWGKPILAEQIDAKLATGEFDAVTLIHSETSTGTLSPLEEIAKLKKKYPDVMFIVDVVSSLSTRKIAFDELGVDVMLAGLQKAMALPPGAAVFAVSEAAFKKAEQLKDRGYYGDFIEYRANHEKNMTPTTPSISHFYALESKLEDILTEGLDARFARHLENVMIVREWAKKNGFELFPELQYATVGLTCIKNNRNIDVAALTSWLKKNKNVQIDGGYGKIKGQTFRISSMGDETTANIYELMGYMDEALKAIGA
ncbi:MAG: alanine--glyoxylate aminotransferase family protein [Verrucomicrobiales bacterium]|jgi:aspartate aminotransferase-like enzyme|nr:alanine--glyoxylate aminotransferase family protein [Verrucomicrobiales bacterium]